MHIQKNALLMLCICSSVQAGIIKLTFYPYPDIHKTLSAAKKAGYAAHQHLAHLVNPTFIAGIFAAYAGYLKCSDHLGSITFARKQSTPQFHILITRAITPAVMFEQTIAYWTIDNPSAAQMYTCIQKTDPETELTFWEVQNMVAPSSHEQIPVDTIIIFAHPNNIHLPAGITVTSKDQNLLLPPLYVKKGIQVTDDALYVLNLAHLFGQVHLAHSKAETYYSYQPKEQ